MSGAGYHTLYLSLRRVAAHTGGVASAGKRVGAVVARSRGEASHLQFQLRTPGGVIADPLDWLRPI